MGQSIVLALISAAIFYDSSGPTMKDMQNLAGALFFMCVATFMPGYMMTGLTFQTERPVFLREQANKMYDVLPYYCAKILADIPTFFIIPVIFTAITYYAVGLTKDSTQFFMFCLTAIMNTVTGVSLGYMISSVFTNAAMALAVAPIIAMPLMLVGGFFQN